jgi:hypothetical protein
MSKREEIELVEKIIEQLKEIGKFWAIKSWEKELKEIKGGG